jgi:hypothetical protein
MCNQTHIYTVTLTQTCLLSLQVWRVCDDVRELWTKATLHQLNEEDTARSIELYGQCLWYLSRVLEKFVKGERTTENPCEYSYELA